MNSKQLFEGFLQGILIVFAGLLLDIVVHFVTFLHSNDADYPVMRLLTWWQAQTYPLGMVMALPLAGVLGLGVVYLCDLLFRASRLALRHFLKWFGWAEVLIADVRQAQDKSLEIPVFVFSVIWITGSILASVAFSHALLWHGDILIYLGSCGFSIILWMVGFMILRAFRKRPLALFSMEQTI